MFDSLKSMASLAGLMKDMPRIKAKFEHVKAELAETTVKAEEGGGAVSVTANGAMQILSVEVHPILLASLVNANAGGNDLGYAQNLIRDCVNAALLKSRQAAERAIAQAADDLGIQLPTSMVSGLLS
ncbi:MAG TPA: YbaB/EbfC family nucleoid-associated protein [Phycisphaerales bacterium]|nr:YbaB/EbfC family nucleoid-associated protein [Phycisphaerales bacterium]